MGASHELPSRAGHPGVATLTRPVFLFPGQSSASPAALHRARQAHPAAEDLFWQAARVLGPEATRRLDGRETPLECNRDVQVAVFLATQLYLAALTAEGVISDCSMGLSLGEYSHLVHIGAIDFDDALALVDARGRCFDEAPPGIMITILGVDRGTVEEAVSRARAHGTVVISNYNTPTQHVISGEPAAVEWAAHALEDESGALATVIERRVPMHSPLMRDVAVRFREAIDRAPLRRPREGADYWPNVDGEAMPGASASDIADRLERHVREPVRWQSGVDAAVAANPGATFVEVGPGAVLFNLIGRAWRGVPRARVDGPDDRSPACHFSDTVESVRARD
jgi:[acyl-carrier-protein] S-malonyltransferase